MRKGKGKTGISVQMNEQDAKRVVNSYSTNREYLENLVVAYVPDSNPSKMSYNELKHHGYVIKGIANKILRKVEKFNSSLERELVIKRMPKEEIPLFR